MIFQILISNLLNLSMSSRSIFKKYNYNYLKNNTTLFENKLYFPKGCKIDIFNKEMNENLLFFIQTVIFCRDDDMIFYDKKELDILEEKDIEKLDNLVLRCTKELIYNRIRSFYNYVTDESILHLSLVAVELAFKIILGYDHSNIEDSLHICNEWLDGDNYDLKLLNKFEIDLLKFSNFHVAPKVRKRVGDLL